MNATMTHRRCLVRQVQPALYVATIEQSIDGGRSWVWCSDLGQRPHQPVSYERAIEYGREHADAGETILI